MPHPGAPSISTIPILGPEVYIDKTYFRRFGAPGIPQTIWAPAAVHMGHALALRAQVDQDAGSRDPHTGSV